MARLGQPVVLDARVVAGIVAAIVNHREDNRVAIPADGKDNAAKVVTPRHLCICRRRDDCPVGRGAVPARQPPAVLHAQPISLLERVAGHPELARHCVRRLEVRLLARAGGDVQRRHQVKQLHAVERQQAALPQRPVHTQHVHHRLGAVNVLRHAADAHAQQRGKGAHVALRVDDEGADDDHIGGGHHHAVGVGAVVRRNQRLREVGVNLVQASAAARVGHAQIGDGVQPVRPGNQRAMAALAALGARRGRNRQRREDAARRHSRRVAEHAGGQQRGSDEAKEGCHIYRERGGRTCSRAVVSTPTYQLGKGSGRTPVSISSTAIKNSEKICPSAGLGAPTSRAAASRAPQIDTSE